MAFSDLPITWAITAAEPSSEQHTVQPAETLAELVLRCQRGYYAWANASRERPAERVRLVQLYQRDTTALYTALERDLRQLAARWRRDLASDDLDVIALNLFALIVIELPRLRVDPARNVRGLLLTVASNRQTDDIRKLLNLIRTPAESHHNNPALSHGPSRCAPLGADPLDHASEDVFDAITERVDREHLLQRLRTEYWPQRLTDVDQRIMHLRYQTEPWGFAAIATDLGTGWTEDAVRTRHHRILKDTRRYLHEHGLI